MDSNQAVNFKPAYSHPHINIYNTPVIGASVPGLSFASGLNLVSASTNCLKHGDFHEGNYGAFNALASHQVATSSSSNTAQLVPISCAGKCLSDLQAQQLTTHPQAITFATNQADQVQITDRDNIQASKVVNQISHFQIATSLNASILNGGNVESKSTIARKDMNQTTSKLYTTNYNRKDPSNEPTSKSKAMSEGGQKNSRQNFSKSSNLSALCNQRSINNVDYVGLVKMDYNGSNSNGSDMRHSSSTSSIGDNHRRCFKCHICDRDFTQKGNLKTHLMTHSGERPYECQRCGKNFTQKGNLDTHVKIHTETKDHKCQYCDRGFTQRGNLKTHVRSVHTKEKPYACGHCGKAFSQKGNMLTHYRTHDKDARFPCGVCGKTFSQKGNLKTHQQRHGRDS